MRTLAVLFLAFTGCSQPGNGGPTDGGGSGSSHDGGNGSGSGDGGITMTNEVSIIVEPNGNKASELVAAINGAQHSVYMTMYQIDDTSIIDALSARAMAGLDVEAVLDGSTTNKSGNTPAYNTLQAAGANVVWSSTGFTYTHEKSVIIDTTQAWIMTMNANTSSPEYDREYLAIDTNAGDIAEATAVFHADHALMSITPSGALVVADTNARSKLIALIESATKSLDIEVEELSDMAQGGVVDAIVAAMNRGLAVRVVIADQMPFASTQTEAISAIKAAGGKVLMTGPTSSDGTTANPYIAAKTILVDCVTGACTSGYVGSENFSGGSLGYNRELGVIFDQASELAKIEIAFGTDYAAGVAQ